MNDARRTVTQRVAELTEDTISLTQALVRIDSLNPTLPGVVADEVIGGEALANDLLATAYAGAAAAASTSAAPESATSTAEQNSVVRMGCR